MHLGRHYSGDDSEGSGVMDIVSYGGGPNSTSELIGMYQRETPVDLILFADTGGERPETYEYIQTFSQWLKNHGMPEITILEYHRADGSRMTLEDECLRDKILPSIAYGFKRCSLKHKIGVQDKFCNNYEPCREAWSRGEKIIKHIGYDAGEENRMENAAKHDEQDKKYLKSYDLIEWGWTREDCEEVIKKEGLPLPGKSSCFFCPSMKKQEIRELYLKHRDLYDRAIAIEKNAKEWLTTIKGLGRAWSWEAYINARAEQVSFFNDMVGVPCNCYDG